MSKSRGNVVTPMHLIEQYGADAIRYWAAAARLGTDTAFDDKVLKVGKRLVTKLFNAGKFVLGQEGDVAPIDAELDRAFAHRLRALVDPRHRGVRRLRVRAGACRRRRRSSGATSPTPFSSW